LSGKKSGQENPSLHTIPEPPILENHILRLMNEAVDLSSFIRKLEKGYDCLNNKHNPIDLEAGFGIILAGYLLNLRK
jgi:hypothetical protein